MVVVYFGGVSGEEFNPYSLQRRTFHYYQIPGVRIQITPISRQTISTDFGGVVIGNKWVKTKSTSRWHLVWASIANRQMERGDASILTEFIGDNNSVWSRWSDAQPVCAKRFWPEVIDLARRNHYLLIPELMAVAEGATDTNFQEFDRELQATLISQYLQAAAIERQAAAGSDDKAAAEAARKRQQEMVDYAKSYAANDAEFTATIQKFEDDAE